MTNTVKYSPLGNFSSMLKTALGTRVNQAASGFLELMAHDCVMEFPYARHGGTRIIRGRTALAQYLATINGIIDIEEITTPTVHQTLDSNVVIVEFDCIGIAVKTGKPYNQNYISVITTRDGHIIHYRDYWNPLIVLAAIGESDMPAESTTSPRGTQS